MARQEVTFDEVAAAATGLQDDSEQVTIDAVREVLGKGTAHQIQPHLTVWRADYATPAEVPPPAVSPSLAAELGRWAEQFAEQAGAGARAALAQADNDLTSLRKASEELEAERDIALATAAERGERVERLTVELRDARQVASDALVGKAKDHLAIEGKDSQLADLRHQLERNVAAVATESDKRLAAEMELVGAATARDNFAAEIKDLRAQLEAAIAERAALRAELEVRRPNL